MRTVADTNEPSEAWTAETLVFDHSGVQISRRSSDRTLPSGSRFTADRCAENGSPSSAQIHVSCRSAAQAGSGSASSKRAAKETCRLLDPGTDDLQFDAIEQATVVDDGDGAPERGGIVQRVRIEHHHVGDPSGLDGANLLTNAEGNGRPGSCAQQHIGDGDAGGNEGIDLLDHALAGRHALASETAADERSGWRHARWRRLERRAAVWFAPGAGAGDVNEIRCGGCPRRGMSRREQRDDPVLRRRAFGPGRRRRHRRGAQTGGGECASPTLGERRRRVLRSSRRTAA